MLKRFLEWFRGVRPHGFLELATARPRAAFGATAGLYVLTVDFRVDEEAVKAIAAALDPVKQKYGLDFIVLEPGMRLTRFDDI